MGITGDGPRLARWGTLTLRWLAGLALLVVLACGAIAVALQVTPMQTVTVAGQVIQVGATAPDLSLAGPGEIDLFGQSLPTNTQFTGPVRPRLRLRSEERRVGKECRSRWSPCHRKQKDT